MEIETEDATVPLVVPVSSIENILDVQECLHIMGTCTVITNLHRSIFLLYFSFPSNPTLHTVYCFRTTSRHTRKCRGSSWGNSNRSY